MPDGSTVSEIAAIRDLPPVERAAAIMPAIYIQTIHRPDVDWQTDLAPSWSVLDERAKAFNLAILETWTRHPDLLELWTETVRGMGAAARPPGNALVAQPRLEAPRQGTALTSPEARGGA